MYSYNKTRVWLDNVEKREKDSLISECQKEGEQIRRQFK